MTDDKEPIQSRDTQSRTKQERRGTRRGRTLGVYKTSYLWSPFIPWMGDACPNKVCHFAPFSMWIAFLGSQSICHFVNEIRRISTFFILSMAGVILVSLTQICPRLSVPLSPSVNSLPFWAVSLSGSYSSFPVTWNKHSSAPRQPPRIQASGTCVILHCCNWYSSSAANTAAICQLSIIVS